ncbi:cystatin-like fold lipoprotein, partial [Staphylococcus aureus]|nr:cystatin-like fold lipoprotein [Staphylococcus aureus]
MKRILVVFLMLAIILAGCSNKGEKYQKDIDKVYKEQNQMNKIASKVQNTIKTDIKQEDSNTHVYKDGKVIVIGIQLYKDR